MPSGTILPVKVVDLDTGAGTDNANGLAVLLPASGGAVVGGTSTNPLRTDPTGTTTQPVSDGGGSLTVDGSLTTVATVTTITNVVHVDDNAGTLSIDDGAGSITVDGTFWQATQPISASALPLPSGAATAANQSTANTSLSSIDGKITAVNTGAVVISSSALPSGAATAANQSTANTSLSSLDTKLGEVQASPTANTVLDRLKAIATALAGTLTVATHAVTQSGTWTVQPGNTANTTAWKVDGSAVTQPVSIADGSDSATGAKADSVASTDTGTFSLIALFKLSLTKLTTISTNIATLAAAVVSSVVTVGVAEKSLTWVTGTVSASGDTTIISAPGSLQNKIVFFQIQNESSTATTVIMKFGTTAKHRVLCQNQGDGVTFIAPAGRAWGVGTTTLLALNLSGANSVGYTVAYFNEA